MSINIIRALRLVFRRKSKKAPGLLKTSPSLIFKKPGGRPHLAFTLCERPFPLRHSRESVKAHIRFFGSGLFPAKILFTVR
jgi:hypothetical protein